MFCSPCFRRPWKQGCKVPRDAGQCHPKSDADGHFFWIRKGQFKLLKDTPYLKESSILDDLVICYWKAANEI